MVTQDYVNSPADEGRKRRENSGQSNVIKVVGISFGLLCITQAALNIYLRLQGDGIVKSDLIPANVSLPSNVSALQLERDQLETENMELQAAIDCLSRERKELSDENSLKQRQIAELQELIEQLNKKLNATGCDSGWTEYMSSCYQLSSGRATRRYAALDCEEKGAHLIFLNNDHAQDVLIFWKRPDVWIGLKAVHQHRKTTWVWDDGSRLTANRTPRFLYDDQNSYCVYAEVQLDGFMVWFQAPCADLHYWVCVKDLK